MIAGPSFFRLKLGCGSTAPCLVVLLVSSESLEEVESCKGMLAAVASEMRTTIRNQSTLSGLSFEEFRLRNEVLAKSGQQQGKVAVQPSKLQR